MSRMAKPACCIAGNLFEPGCANKCQYTRPCGPPINCFVLTSRLPSDRLASGFRYSQPHGAATLDELVGAFQQHWSRPNMSSLIVRARTKELYGQEVRGPRTHALRAEWQKNGGSGLFFETVVHPYLLGADELCAAGKIEVHVLCVERLVRDVARLGATFGVDLSNVPHAQYRSKSGRSANVSAASTLTPANAVWLDEVVYPAETALHRALCAS
jgi:hypothetical protein